MSVFIEIPQWEDSLAFRTFIDEGREPVAPHRHKEIEIIQMQEGTAKLGIADQLITLCAGEVYIISSGIPHYLLAAPLGCRRVYQFDLGLFDHQMLKMNVGELNQRASACEPKSSHWPIPAQDSMANILNRLSVASELESRAAIVAGLYDLVDLMLNTLPRRTNQTITNAGADLRAKTAIKQLTTLYNFIDTHYLEPISLDEVANELGFNPQYFSRFFKRNTGETFGQFLTRYRLMKACYLLATDDSPISEIAEQSGFNTDKTFHRVFKRRMGITPRMYRVRIQKNTR